MISVLDTVIRIKNGYMAKKIDVVVPGSKITKSVLEKLISEGFIASFTVEQNGIEKFFKVQLSYENGKAKFADVEIVSKPGQRKYVKATEIPSVLNGLGTAFLSTTSGIMTGKEARKASLGGELLFNIW